MAVRYASIRTQMTRDGDSKLSGNGVIRQCDAHGTVEWLSRRDAMPPKIDGILESSLYVSDVLRAVRFYEETLGFENSFIPDGVASTV
jgi:hypothetical protein